MLALTKLRLELIIIFLPLIAVAEPISETEWSRCAAVKDDRERLVCFDGITLKQPVNATGWRRQIVGSP